ncbi:hypothetical protein D3C72_2261170 [compost metagenome]
MFVHRTQTFQAEQPVQIQLLAQPLRRHVHAEAAIHGGRIIEMHARPSAIRVAPTADLVRVAIGLEWIEGVA